MKARKNIHRKVFPVVLFVVLVGFAFGAAAQDPVTVDVEVTGDPMPGATVTATATVTVNDGSTFQSIAWSQIGGLSVTLANETTNTVSITFPDRMAYREHLIHVLEEPPSATGPLPGDIPVPDPFYGGLQHRWQVVGINPLAEEHAAAAEMNIAVTTSSGTYDVHEEVMANLPWAWMSGQRNQAVGVPIILHGKTQDTYDWMLTAPAGSASALTDATTKNPEFTPDMVGEYTVTVTDSATDPETPAPVSITIYAGTWRGVIVGQDSEGRPIADNFCTMCHNGDIAGDQFTPWIKSGHAEILTSQVNTENNHYGERCVACHTVGYDLDASNNGVDDVGDWAGAVAILENHGALDNWTNMLAQFPDNAQRMNIQCENCHGPNSGADESTLGPGHGKGAARTDLSSDTCAVCHGEPPRHGRFQQWQLSKHSNYNTAEEEGTSGSCSQCHSGQGFVAWVESGYGDYEVTWTTDEVHPITCATCHEPHDVGTTSGGASTNSTVRIMGDTPMLDSGYVAEDVGKAATCMACHNGRRGLRNDDNFGSDIARAPHQGPQADVLMGQNMYFVETGTPGFHSKVENSCVACHMEETDPPPGLSYNLGGTNHTFFASPDICSNCHTAITAESIQGPVHEKAEDLKHEIEANLLNLMRGLLLAGNTIDLNGTVVTDPFAITAVEFVEYRGRQGMTVTVSGEAVGPVRMPDVDVTTPAGTTDELYAFADSTLPKAGWNFFTVESDRSMGVHNPGFVMAALDVTIHAVEAVNANYDTTIIGGGPGTGVGAVACTTPYVYWAEIVGHISGGEGTEWRTDLVTKNLAAQDASLTMYLHDATGILTGTTTVTGGSQVVFEDVVGTVLGGTSNIGSLEVCSDLPILMMSRIYNMDVAGTYGQAFDGKVAASGFGAGETVSIIGMRQMTDLYRTNLSVTNGSTTDGEVSITLYTAAGTAAHTYTLPVVAGQVVQDTAPFANRAAMPDVGWGYATVTIVSGSNMHVSGSMLDLTTHDPTTLPAKQ